MESAGNIFSSVNFQANNLKTSKPINEDTLPNFAVSCRCKLKF